MQKFGVIGGGAWGTALGAALRRAGREVLLWAREDEVVEAINARHENTKFLAGVALDPALRATNALDDLTTCDALVLVTPTQHTRAICCAWRVALGARPAPPIIVCAKGIEQGTLLFPADIVRQEIPTATLAVLSGPTFAVEVAKNQPTAITLACVDGALGQTLTRTISSLTFRPYLSDDILGAQVGGAVKNVLAVACGIAAGCGMGDNARAALITRGLAEMTRLGLALGGRAETLVGLSGMGDLVLTCSSTQSRNMSLGFALGQGTRLADILASRSSVAEGVHTAAAAAALAQKHSVDMPIVAAVDAILNHGAATQDTVNALLARPLKAERG